MHSEKGRSKTLEGGVRGGGLPLKGKGHSKAMVGGGIKRGGDFLFA